MATEIFIQISLVILLATLISFLMRILRQPLIIGYILTGIVVGPAFLNFFNQSDTITTFAKIGIALLLFMVGLSLNPKIIKDLGKVSLITGVGQFVFTALIGFFIGRALGLSTINSTYISVALTFSSTIIIAKLLSDKRDLETLYGKISIGFLIVQDLIAILILMVISSISNGVNLESLIFSTLVKGIISLGVLFLISIYILPPLTKVIAKSQEFLLLFSVAWCLLIATIFYYLNSSFEIGALLAGISLAISPYRYEISSKMTPIRDFFIVLFFIFLGSQMTFSNISQYSIPIIVFSLFVLIGNPLILIILMGMLGYTKRNSFLVGLTVAQISEFSLILISVGVTIGHLTNEILSLVTFIGLITIAASAYFIMYSEKIYTYFSGYLTIFERKGRKVDEYKTGKKENFEVILFGCNRAGYSLLKSILKLKKNYIIVDFNPEIIKKLSARRIKCIYGDADDTEFLKNLQINKSEIVISTVPDYETNSLILNYLKEIKSNTVVILTAEHVSDALRLYKEGADYVILPHFIGGSYASTIIEKFNDNKELYKKERENQMKELREELEERN